LSHWGKKERNMQEAVGPDNDELQKGEQRQFDQLPIINFANVWLCPLHQDFSYERERERERERDDLNQWMASVRR
jgi:hypothetical protein